MTKSSLVIKALEPRYLAAEKNERPYLVLTEHSSNKLAKNFPAEKEHRAQPARLEEIVKADDKKLHQTLRPKKTLGTKLKSPKMDFVFSGFDHFVSPPRTNFLPRIIRAPSSVWTQGETHTAPASAIKILALAPSIAAPSVYLESDEPNPISYLQKHISSHGYNASKAETKKTTNIFDAFLLTPALAKIYPPHGLADSVPTTGVSIWHYIFGTHPINLAAEEKMIRDIGLPGGATARKVRVNVGPLSTAFERTDTGRNQFDVRVGARPGSVGIAFGRGSKDMIRPYGRLGWMQMRLKFYGDHVSVKFESSSRAVNGLGRAVEIRMSKPEWKNFREILTTKGELAAEQHLFKTYGVKLTGLKRLTSISHGVGGFLAELGLFLVVGQGIDILAEHYDFDPDFRGRSPVQVGATVALVQIIRALLHRMKTGQLPENLMQTAACATAETALTMGVFSAVGASLDGITHELGFKQDFWGRTVVQLAATYGLILMAKAALGNKAPMQCRRVPPSNPDKPQDGIQSSIEESIQPQNTETPTLVLEQPHAKAIVVSALQQMRPVTQEQVMIQESPIQENLPNSPIPTLFEHPIGIFGAYAHPLFSPMSPMRVIPGF